jgi:hypothetical protein
VALPTPPTVLFLLDVLASHLMPLAAMSLFVVDDGVLFPRHSFKVSREHAQSIAAPVMNDVTIGQWPIGLFPCKPVSLDRATLEDAVAVDLNSASPHHAFYLLRSSAGGVSHATTSPVPVPD